MKREIFAIASVLTALNLAFAEEPNMGENIFATKDQMTNNYVDNNIKIETSEPPMSEEEQALTQKYRSEQWQRMKKYQIEEGESSKEQNGDEIALLKSAMRNENLNALQQKFFEKGYTGYENTKNLEYSPNKTHKIRTRAAMATTLIFETNIQSYILGDKNGFNIEEIPDMPNAIAIKPLLIGIDTSLTVFTKDKKIHTFYVFSTSYKNSKDPNFVIYINDEDTARAELKNAKQENADILIIKEGIAELKINKKDISRNYTQKALRENAWLVSEEIFSDKKFTYFKYDKNKMPQIPTIFAVIDKQDSPVETRVIGDYIIAESISTKWTIKSGNSYVCVSRGQDK